MKLLLKSFIYSVTVIAFAGCTQPQEKKEAPDVESTKIIDKIIDVQGHRGSRGLMPENTIPAFLKALEFNKVTTLELDLAVTKDKKLVVSHEPWMNPVICIGKDGESLSEEEKVSIYQLTYDETKAYDCGSIGNPRFPNQEKMSINKPLLIDLITAVNKKLKEDERGKIQYNIEIKSNEKYDELLTPGPEEFSDIVYEFIVANMNTKEVTIQSFDFRVLKYFNQTYPDIKLVALIENDSGITSNLAALGFKPAVYSPYYKVLSEKSIDSLHQQDIAVIPWTVNDTTDMKELIRWDVDGIITDYPNLAQKLLE